MEFPPLNHHHHHPNRYAPPPPPTNFSDDRTNLYPHHQHLLPSLHLPPPPPFAYPSLPPPPPPPLPVPPPPPSYNSHQSNFTFLDAQNPSFLNHGRSSPPQPRFSNQSQRFAYRTDSWSDSHRVPPEPTHRNPILVDDHHRRLYSPDSRSESHYKPHVSERLISSSRYRDETIINGYAGRDASNIVSQEQQVFRGSCNNDDGRNIDRYASAQASGSNSRNLEDFVEKYEPRYISNSENERVWDHHGEDSRRIHQMKGGKKNEFGHSDGVLRDYEYESSRVSRVREEFKQVQKKSVLLRIGKPNNPNRNRSHDQHFSKAHMVESNNSSNLRGKDRDRDRDRDRDHHASKDSSLYVDHRTEGDREHSPVELDVSFKSNALVAKAVSSPVIDNNNNNNNNNTTQLRNKKSKRAAAALFDSPLKRSGSSSNGIGLEECPCSSEKAPKQQKVKDSSGTNEALGQGGGVSVVGPLSFKLKKKRKLINFKNSPTVSIFQLAEKDDKSENKTASVPSTSKEPIPSKAEEAIIMVSEKDSSEVDKVSKINDVSSQNEQGGSLNLENDAQQVPTDDAAKVVPLDDGIYISASSGQDVDQIQVPTEPFITMFPENLNNASVKIQETSNTACSDEEEVITLDSENGNTVGCFDGASRKKEASLEGTPNAIAEDDAVVSSGKCYNKSSEIQSDLTVSGEKHENVGPTPSSSSSSSIKVVSSDEDEDEFVDIVELNSESVETQRPPGTHETYLLPKDDLPPSLLSILSTCPDDDKSPMPADMLTTSSSSIVSSQKVSGSIKDQRVSSSNPNNDGNICEKFVPGLLNCPDTSVESSKTSIKPIHVEVSANTTTKTAATSQQQQQQQGGLSRKMQEGSSLAIKKPDSASTTRPSPVFTNTRINNHHPHPPSKSIVKPRTWHRSVNNSVSVVPPRPPKQIGMLQNAYIRSGNTLVRKGSPVLQTTVPRSSIYQLNPAETRTASAVVRPKTPPLSAATKLPDSTTVGRALEVGPEDENGTTSSESSQKTLLSLLDQGPGGKMIGYVKPKSNQLVAASSTSDRPVQELDKTQQASSSDGYYKRRKNQLIRTLVGADYSDVEKKAAQINNNIKRHSGKGISKKYRSSRFSSVWTLGAQPSLGVSSLRQKLRPHQLFPWKRSKYWGNVSASMHTSSNTSSSSLISRKLVGSRKREMIYTRSKHGFSLRMSKLLSVGGSSLKWSKSIEKNSKRANEEATLAVAAAEKKRREQHLHMNPEIKSSRNINMSRDRIFRIGLVRYKMDPSRRTLQRISDQEEPSTSKKSKDEVSRRSYVPKRLLIGHDEYLRIGNGNQLVRNPKRRTRLFANEKVRWSLHTARSRLARKKKYCQFFTRFGKCNKKDDDGKCQYIHDSSKIAVCTKFLKGLCSNPDCKLTHKVIPERMQDCSYFLQGLCSNEHCPYRHVNVKSDASVCEDFLKGYCADGNECRKKHTYACPVFEATGECSQPTVCRLHHPKHHRNTAAAAAGLKRRKPHTTSTTTTTTQEGRHHKNSRGRYFGAVGATSLMPVSERRHHFKDDDDDGLSWQHGNLADYISLEEEEEEELEDAMMISDETTMVTSEAFEDLGEATDLDDLTKPIRIMNQKPQLGSHMGK